MLYLVATPIGNLKDMTYRAIEILQSSDYILCEDTRTSSILLRHYQIQRPLKSYHKFNEASKELRIIEDLEEGKTIALISDAGTPGISDPGTKLVQACIENGIKVISIPGPCAAICALSSSGLDTDRFQFYGFLPRKKGELKTVLQDLLHSKLTSICYESPNRLLETLDLIHELAAERSLCVARELTKKFEEMRRGTASDLQNHWKSHPLKGEVILMIAGRKESDMPKWEEWDEVQHVKWMESTYSLSRSEAIKMVAEIRGLPKRQIYNKVVKD